MGNSPRLVIHQASEYQGIFQISLIPKDIIKISLTHPRDLVITKGMDANAD
jgi:hypothetical protein